MVAAVRRFAVRARAVLEPVGRRGGVDAVARHRAAARAATARHAHLDTHRISARRGARGPARCVRDRLRAVADAQRLDFSRHGARHRLDLAARRRERARPLWARADCGIGAEGSAVPAVECGRPAAPRRAGRRGRARVANRGIDGLFEARRMGSRAVAAVVAAPRAAFARGVGLQLQRRRHGTRARPDTPADPWRSRLAVAARCRRRDEPARRRGSAAADGAGRRDCLHRGLCMAHRQAVAAAPLDTRRSIAGALA